MNHQNSSLAFRPAKLHLEKSVVAPVQSDSPQPTPAPALHPAKLQLEKLKSPVLLEVGAEIDEEPSDGAAGKHRATRERKCTIRKKRKFDLTRPAAMTVGLVPQRINALSVGRGSQRYRVFRLVTGSFSGDSKAVVMVRTESLVCGMVVSDTDNPIVFPVAPETLSKIIKAVEDLNDEVDQT